MSGKNKHHASKEWLHERYAGAVSIVLMVWLIANLICMDDFGIFLAKPLNAILLIIFLASFIYYTTLAMKVVFEDYIYNIKLRDCLIKLMYFAGIIGFIIGDAAILKILFS